MEDEERYRLQDELRASIESGDIETAAPKKLQQWLLALGTGRIANESVRHNAIILGFTINHIRTEQMIRQLEETIKKLNMTNNRSQWIILFLTIIATIAAVIQVVYSLK